MADYDAIVIGSGAGGLASALRLARLNFSVLLLEAMPAFGGYLNPFYRKGYTFDTGLHFLLGISKGESLWKILQELGINDTVKFIELNPEGYDHFIFPDYEFRVCNGRERFKEKLINDFPKEERGIIKFFEVSDKILKAVEDTRSMDSGLFGILGFIIKHPIMLKYSRVPYQSLLDQLISDKRLKAVLSAPSLYYGTPPARASAILAVLVWMSMLRGGVYPHGGSGAFKEAFVSGLFRHGAELKNNSRVVAIDKHGNDFLVETEAGEQYSSGVVISNVDPVITLGKLVNPERIPSKIIKKVKGLRPSQGSFYAFIGTDLDLPSIGITDANITYYDSYDINKIFENQLTPNPPEVFPNFFITSPSVKDPDGRHAPEGFHTLGIFTWAISYNLFEKWAGLASMKRGEDYQILKKEIGDRLIISAENYVPGLSSHIDIVEYATPLSNEYWVNAVRGGNYGLDNTPDQFGKGRFNTFTAGVDGLFLAGAGTLGCGVMTCVASGFLSANKASEYLSA
jgi:phytoene desaturase